MLTCLSCNQPIADPQAAFCPRCGQSLSGAAGQPPTGGQTGWPNVSSAPMNAAALPGQEARRRRLLPGIGGLVCGPLSILAFFILSWWLYVSVSDSTLNETLSAWALTNPMLASNAPRIVLLLWLIPISGLLLALLGLLHVTGTGSRKVLSLLQLVGAFVGLITVAGYFSYVQAWPRFSSEVHISYGPGFWVALLAFVGIFVFAMVDLLRR